MISIRYGEFFVEDSLEIETVSTIANLSPEMGLRHGEPLRFVAKQFYFDGSNGDYMPVGSQEGMLIALSFRDDDGHHTTGSAAMVGPGVAICGTHVLEDQGFFEKLIDAGATLVAQAPVPGGLLLWTVTHISTVPESDLAVLSMTLTSDFPADRRFIVASITTRMPAVGEELTLTGLSAVRQTEEISNFMRIELMPGCMKGRVLDIYPDGRDFRLPERRPRFRQQRLPCGRSGICFPRCRCVVRVSHMASIGPRTDESRLAD